MLSEIDELVSFLCGDIPVGLGWVYTTINYRADVIWNNEIRRVSLGTESWRDCMYFYIYFKRLGDLRQEELKDETERKYSEKSNHKDVIHSNPNEYNAKK